MKLLRLIISLCIAIVFFGCKNHDGETKLVIYTRAPLNTLLYVSKPGYFDQKETNIDSAIVKSNHDSLVFYIPKTEERMFKIGLKDNGQLPVSFVNDSRLIRVHIDYFADTSNIAGSPATLSLIKFEQSQQVLSAGMKSLSRQMDSLRKLNKFGKPADSLKVVFKYKLGAFFARYKAYADTVKSPAVFMHLFNTIDYGPDYEGLKKFILSNAQRFPTYAPIQELKRQTMVTVKIYEKDLHLGDQIPAISLNDQNMLPFSTLGLRGKYYLIDFWSTWCQQCIVFKNAEYHFYKTHPNTLVQFVGVALDDHVDDWKKIVRQFKHPTIELIDTKMWQGPTVNALVFDSIPYNFLVNPKGEIIAKAIKPDSLMEVINRLVKRK